MTQQAVSNDELYAFAQKLMDAGVGIIAGAKVEIGPEWARNPKVIALTLLSRALGNLKGSVIMVREGLIVEARTLTRSACENLICIGGLAARGTEFVNDLVAAEARSRQRKGNFLLETVQSDSLATIEDKLRGYLEELEEKHPHHRPLNLRQVADASAVRHAYLWFMELSSDAAHVSASSLNRQLVREHESDSVYLKVDVAPSPREAEMHVTLERLCTVVLGVLVGANDVLGGTPVGVVLRSLADELDALKGQCAT